MDYSPTCSAAQKHWETEIYICFAGRITASVFIISSSENGKYVHRSMAAEREVEPFNLGKKKATKMHAIEGRERCRGLEWHRH